MARAIASRPRPISTRPTRGWLLRGSKVHQEPSKKTSIHAQKSMGSFGGTTPTSGRYPNVYRVGMLSARQNVTARWAKSRHTPLPAWSTSWAVLTDVLVPYPNEIGLWAELQTAWTRGHPGVTSPKSSHAVLASSSEGHSRLGKVK